TSSFSAIARPSWRSNVQPHFLDGSPPRCALRITRLRSPISNSPNNSRLPFGVMTSTRKIGSSESSKYTTMPISSGATRLPIRKLRIYHGDCARRRQQALTGVPTIREFASPLEVSRSKGCRIDITDLGGLFLPDTRQRLQIIADTYATDCFAIQAGRGGLPPRLPCLVARASCTLRPREARHMDVFEWVIGLMFGAALLSMLARRIGLPYPSLLAVGGAAVALLPMSPTWTLDPQLALTLFVAPVLLDAAYDFSLRDLKRNWVPVAGLAVAAVGVTTAAVALVARWLIPDMPWSIAVALGAIVAPPDAAAATAVMRQIKLPHRIRTILEGESLVNDASALLVYRLAIGAAVAGNLTIAGIVPTAIAVIVGSIAVGILLSRLLIRLIASIRDVPIAIIVQFV